MSCIILLPQTTTNPGLFNGSEDYTHYPYPDEYMSSMQYMQQPPRAGSQPPRQTDCKLYTVNFNMISCSSTWLDVATY